MLTSLSQASPLQHYFPTCRTFRYFRGDSFDSHCFGNSAQDYALKARIGGETRLSCVILILIIIIIIIIVMYLYTAHIPIRFMAVYSSFLIGRG